MQNLLYKQLIEQSNEFIWSVNPNFQLEYSNQAYLNLMKDLSNNEKKINEYIFIDSFGEGNRKKWEAYYKRTFKGEIFELEETYFNKKKNALEHYWISFKPIYGEKQDIQGIACQSRDITEKVNTIKQLETNELFNRTVLESSPDCLKILDTEGRLQFMNFNGLCQMEIDDFESIKNNEWWTLWGSENEELVKSSVNQALAGETVQFTAFCRTMKGNPKWWDVVLSPIGKSGETVQQIISVSRDVTKQKEEEEKLKAVSAIANIGYWRLELNGNTLSWTDEVYKIWGREREKFELNYENFTKTIHPSDLQLFEKGQAIAYQGLAPLDQIHRIILPDNQIRWVHERGRLVKDIYGKSIVFEGTVQDITKQKEEEQRLKLLESVIINTKDAVLITEAEPFDEPGPRIIYVNEAFTKMTGYSREEVIGKSPRILQGPNSNKEELAEIGRKIRKWEPCELTTINYKKNGEEFWINFRLTPVANEKGWYTHWISIERDVTEQKHKELENELIAKISLNFAHENDYVNSTTKLCETISHFGQFDWVELWTTSMDKSQIQLLSHFVLDNKDEAFYDITPEIKAFQKSEGLAGKVLKSGKQILLSDIEQSKDFIRKRAAKKIGLESALGIPLIINDEVIGVLTIGIKKKADYLKKFTRIFERLEGFIGAELKRKMLDRDLNHLFISIPDILCLGDFNRKFLKINKAGCELLGYSEDEILHHSFEEFIHPEDKEKTINDFHRLINEGITNAFESRYISKSGAILWLSWTCNALTEEGLIYATAKNITEEKKMRELNRQTRELAKVGGWEYDLIENNLFWSDEVHLLHETDPSAFVPNADRAIDFYKEEHKSFVSDVIYKSINEGVYLDYEAVIITRNKKERWIRVIGSPEYFDGKCIKFIGSFQDITDRKESELRLASLSENLPCVIYQYIIHPDGTDSLNYVSGAVEQVWGYTANQVMEDINLVWDRIKLGGDFEKVIKSILQSTEKKSKWNSRLKYVLPNGEVRIQLGSGFPVFLSDGTIVYNSISLDITNETKNEELLEQVTKLAKIGSWEVDMIQNQPTWTKMIHSILETDPETFVPDMGSTMSFYREDFRDLAQSSLENCITKGITVDFEAIMITAKNTEKWVRMLANVEMIEDKPHKLYGSMQDIDDRKVTEIELAQSENRFRTILEAEPECIKLIGPNNELLMMNPAGLKMIEADNEEVVIGKSILGIILPVHRLAFTKLIEKVFLGESSMLVFEIKGLKGTHRWLETHAVPMKNEKGEITTLLAVTRDITERKKQEVELLTLNQSLQKYAKELERSNEELEQFAFITSHDLQEPLRMIASFMDQLKRKYGDQLDEKALQYIYFATDGAKRMKQIIQDLLVYSRAGSHSDSKEQTDVNDIITGFTQLRRKVITEKSVTFSMSELPTCLTYRVAITQVLHSLLDNAMKYSQKGIAPHIEIKVTQNKNEWKFAIKDNGIGIDTKFHDKIFIIFQRLHNRNEYEGTGIGLSIAKKHIEFMGGKIWLKSSPGVGTTFYFTILK